MTSEHVRIPVDDATMGGYLATPPAPGRYPGVVVAHQLFGVTADIRALADRLASRGFVALAPDFYHRADPGVQLPADDSGRARGFALLRGLTREGVLADVAAARNFLAARSDAAGAVGTLGVSMGGHLAYLAATALPVPVTVVLYGGWLTGTDIPLSTPEPTLELTGGITGRLVYVVGELDHVVSAEQRAAIAARLAADGIDHDVVVVPGAPHAYLSEDADSYRADAAEQTWALIEREFAALRA
jgi:carboxymethylenebutenolidase